MSTRRQFLLACSAAAAAPSADDKSFDPFELRDVRLLPGPCLTATEANARYLHALSPDRLLHTTRLNAGLPCGAAALGGWERPDCEVRGHFMGHYLSACSLMWASTGDEELKARTVYMVAELAKCQDALGNGYLSAFPDEFLARLKAGKRVWAPWYTIHKILAGLLDVSQLCRNEHALSVAEGMAGWAARWSAGMTSQEMARTLEVEHGGMAESLVELYALTHKEEYLNAATRFTHRRVLDPLAEGHDELKGLHANTNIPKVIAAARRYEITGEPRYRAIADFFWRQVVNQRSYVTGGNSNHEHWRTPPGTLAGELGPETQECCCTYNMLKLTRHVFGWSGDARAADFYERALMNSILGTLEVPTGMTMYFVPLGSGYYKLFSRPTDSFWCCTGTGTESFSKLGDSIYFHDRSGIYVNLYIASEVEWREKGVKLRQETDFPRKNTTILRFSGSPMELALHLRIPAWVAGQAHIRVNGKEQNIPSAPGSYATLTRHWTPGDRVELELPAALHSEPLLGDPSLQAFLYGPLVLAGRLGTSGLAQQTGEGKSGWDYEAHAVKGDPVAAPEFVARAGGPAAWIRPVPGKTLEFRTTGQRQDMTLVPLNQLFGERYGVYWKVRT